MFDIKKLKEEKLAFEAVAIFVMNLLAKVFSYFENPFFIIRGFYMLILDSKAFLTFICGLLIVCCLREKEKKFKTALFYLFNIIFINDLYRDSRLRIIFKHIQKLILQYKTVCIVVGVVSILIILVIN